MYNKELFEKSTVLIVDDIQDNIKILGSILLKTGINISVATSGEQAISISKQIIPDLILLDVTMPFMDGFTVCTILKEDKNTEHIPIIFVTARVDTEDVVKGFDVGGVDYITKPFRQAELISRMNTHLELAYNRRLVEESNNTLKVVNQEKDKFFSLIAHDLRSPFSGIMGLAQMMDEGFDTMEKSEMKYYISTIFNSLKTQYSFLENLLEWGNLQLNRKAIEIQKYFVHPLINKKFAVFQELAKTKKIDLKNNVSSELEALFDYNLLNSVLHNLISNAIKYSNVGGEIIISSSLNILENTVTISVADNGIGMKDNAKEKLFKLDQIYTTPGTNDESGSGLGLILVWEMINKLNGKIWFESIQNKGTTFYISLQIPKSEESEVTLEENL